MLLVPRLDGKYANVGTIGVIEQLGRLPGGEQVAVVRGTNRVKIGSGTTGPGAALWVEATVTEEAADEQTAGAGPRVQGAGRHDPAAARRATSSSTTCRA